MEDDGSHRIECWLIQAWMAVSPGHPRWEDITPTALEGWREVLLKFPVGKGLRGHQFAFAGWNRKSDAMAAFFLFLEHEQKHKLRLIHRIDIRSEAVLMTVQSADYSKPGDAYIEIKSGP